MTRTTRMTAEPGTFERLVVAHQAMVWRYLRFLGCPPADADDLVQDTFLAVFGKAIEAFPDDEGRRYLRKVAKHAWLKRIEREGRTPRVDLASSAAYGALEASGPVALDGTLELVLVEGFVPSPGASFIVLTSSALTGTFDSLLLPAEVSWDIAYDAGSVTLTVLP